MKNSGWARKLIFTCFVTVMLMGIICPADSQAADYSQAGEYLRCIREQRYSNAWEMYVSDSAVIYNSYDTGLVGATAFLLYKMQQTASADQLLDMVTIWDPSFNYDYLGLPEAHRYLGLYCRSHIYYVRGEPMNYATTIHSLSIIIEHDTSLEVGNALAWAYASQARIKDEPQLMDRAINTEMKLLASNDTLWSIYSSLGSFNRYKGNFDTATWFYQRALSFGADAYPAYYDLGILYKNQHFYDSAITSFNALIALQPYPSINNVAFDNMVSMCYYQIACCYALDRKARETIGIFRDAKTNGITFPLTNIQRSHDFDLIRDDENFKAYIRSEYGG